MQLIPWTEQLKPEILEALTEYQTEIQAAASIECSSSKKNLVPPAACSFEACCGLMGLRFKRTLSNGDGGESEERSDGSQTNWEKRKRVSAGNIAQLLKNPEQRFVAGLHLT